MDILAISQTIFYFVASGTVIILGILLIVVVFNILMIVRDARRFTDDLAHTYERFKRLMNKLNPFSGGKK